jgi:hypothetical protein
MALSKVHIGALLVLGLIAVGLPSPAFATVQNDDVMCWDPDVETPGACDDDDDQGLFTEL